MWEESGKVEQIAALYYQDVFRYALGIRHNRHDAEDLTQEAYVRFFSYCKKNGGYQSTKIKPALLRLVSNSLIDKIRKDYRIKPMDFEYLSSGKMTPLDEAILSERDELILRKINELPNEQRDTMKMYFYDGLNAIEIAKQKEISVNTILGHLFYGKKKLEQKLKIAA